MSTNGYIMNLQPFSVNDGEGIRTDIFIAGCPLRCAWCSNPEGFEQKEIIGWYKRRCIGCGACAAVCPQGIGIELDHGRCIACGACVNVCPEEARARMVTMTDADDAIKEVQRHRLFYSYSGGGITFSGGEATSQPGLLEYLSRELFDRGYSLALESCGYFDFESVRPSLERMDLIFMDLKHMDPGVHKQYTGVGNELILANIAKLASVEKADRSAGEAVHPDIVIRIPVIGGVNNSEENIAASAAYVHEVLPDAAMELLPYHALGKIKYEALGLSFDQDSFYTPDKEEMKKLRAIVSAQGISLADYR